MRGMQGPDLIGDPRAIDCPATINCGAKAGQPCPPLRAGGAPRRRDHLARMVEADRQARVVENATDLYQRLMREEFNGHRVLEVVSS